MKIEISSGLIMLALIIVLFVGQCKMEKRIEKLETQVTEVIK